MSKDIIMNVMGSYNHIEGRHNSILVTGGAIGQGAGNHIEGENNSLTLAVISHMEGSGNIILSKYWHWLSYRRK